jgi:hypothetical protein
VSVIRVRRKDGTYYYAEVITNPMNIGTVTLTDAPALPAPNPVGEWFEVRYKSGDPDKPYFKVAKTLDEARKVAEKLRDRSVIHGPMWISHMTEQKVEDVPE